MLLRLRSILDVWYFMLMLFKVFWFSISFFTSCSFMFLRSWSILDIRYAAICLVFEIWEFDFLWDFNDFCRCSFSDTLRWIEDKRGNILFNMIMVYPSYWDAINFKLINHANFEIWTEARWINHHFFLQFPLHSTGMVFLQPALFFCGREESMSSLLGKFQNLDLS